jgi:hypothetical protein
MRDCGFPRERCLVSGQLAHSLEDGNIVLPCRDNLTILGLEPGAANSDLKRVMSSFEERGFRLRDIVWASPSARPLGEEIDRVALQLGPTSIAFSGCEACCFGLVRGSSFEVSI